MACRGSLVGRVNNSGHKLNANEKTTLRFSDFERAVALNPIAPLGVMPVVAPVAFGIAG